jgi:hypothetical protein
MSEVKTNKITSLASNNDITLDPDGTGDVVVASGHNVGIGTTSPNNNLHIQTSSGNPELRVESTGANYATMSVKNSSRHYSTQIRTDQSNAYVVRDETGGANRFLIDTSGDVIIGKESASFSTKGFFLNVDPGQFDITCNGNNPLRLNRLASDGILTSYQQAGSEEGTVSVSGTTVSYNGGHLSRWSRLTSGNKDTSIVKGTVMTNLDQMVVWTHAATDDEAEWTEDNEQLNCMAVSSVEGDANVAGVFVNWDDRDSYNDMNIAMTGDMVIRIASGTTVARGDLLMSAGDGTAKPQGDDIVRSKTIAKVTSTTKSHTYDDGSYLVPCVLMAC